MKGESMWDDTENEEHLDEDVSQGTARFLNHYRCPNDGEEWSDEADCQCNDRCPICRAEIEPYDSEDIEESA